MRGRAHWSRRLLAGPVAVVAVVVVVVGLLVGTPVAGPVAAAAAYVPHWPGLHNRSSLTDERADQLVVEAVAGLGFAPGAADGPQAADRFFVGDDYVAWIDQTGFYGKLNGLWWLAPTVSGDRSFTVRDTDGRPVNQLVVGEKGNGAWPKGYRGAEHIEMPNGTPEPGDDAACAQPEHWCNQFSLDEAGRYTQPGIPWWKRCDPGALAYTDVQAPIEVAETADSLRLVYEGRLVKRAEGQIPWSDATGCHEDWLFPDGVRRPVYLRVGYELYAHAARVDRLMQVRNPAGNPPFAGPFSFIGGFVITSWPQPMAAKSINRFVEPENADVGDFYLNRTLQAGTWNPGWTAPIGKDIAFGWWRQPLRLSTRAGDANGSSLRLENLGPSDNLDVGFCLCESHGGVEMGGGLLHTAPAEDAALPLAGGALSIEARRRLETAAPTVIADVAAYGATTTTVSTTSTPPPVAPVPVVPAATAVAVTPSLTG